jgi:hypothetical protein
VFRLRSEQVAAVQAWLDQVQAHWTEQLGAFRRHVEEKEGGVAGRAAAKEKERGVARKERR